MGKQRAKKKQRFSFIELLLLLQFYRCLRVGQKRYTPVNLGKCNILSTRKCALILNMRINTARFNYAKVAMVAENTKKMAVSLTQFQNLFFYFNFFLKDLKSLKDLDVLETPVISGPTAVEMQHFVDFMQHFIDFMQHFIDFMQHFIDFMRQRKRTEHLQPRVNDLLCNHN